MKIEIATLFPEMCEAVLGESIVGRARKAGKIEVHCRQIREYTQDKHRRVDDTPYGGGMGMVMQCEPIYNCYMAVCDEMGCKPHTIYMSPKGKVLTQQRAVELSKMDNILIICGHYEGVDQRVIDKIVDEELSSASRRRASTADCSNIPIIRAPRCGKGRACRRFSFRDTTPTSRSGVTSRASSSPRSAAPTCMRRILIRNDKAGSVFTACLVYIMVRCAKIQRGRSESAPTEIVRFVYACRSEFRSPENDLRG